VYREKVVISAKVKIVPLGNGAIHAAGTLWREAGLLRPWNNPWEDAREAIASPSSVILGGVRTGDLVATTMVGDDGHRGWVYYLAVSQEFRRRGIGRLMMTACESWLKARDTSKVHIMVRLDNKEVAGFYEHLGYGGEEFLFFSKRLA
jgi:ribosomal protein S18 acetylase RimI-like enzyme